MEQLSRSSCRFERVLLVVLAIALSACAGKAPRTAEPVVTRPVIASEAEPVLLALRDYLGLPAGEQAKRRKELAHGATRGGTTARLQYALALSVDRDDPQSLRAARAHFDSLLTNPDPLPVSLDTLVRLQLGQVVDRLERMQRADVLRDANEVASDTLDRCRAALAEQNAELRNLREKLRALARIEQTVENTGEQEEENENHAEPPPDSPR